MPTTIPIARPRRPSLFRLWWTLQRRRFDGWLQRRRHRRVARITRRVARLLALAEQLDPRLRD